MINPILSEQKLLNDANNCPYNVSVNLVFNALTADIIENYSGCSGDGYSYTSPSGTVYDQSNPIGTETLNDANNCPYNVSVNLVFNALTANINESYIGCSGDGYTYNSPSGTVYDESNPSGTENLNDANACPYTVSVSLTYHPVGCNDVAYCEYDPNAVCDDGSCTSLISLDMDCDGVATTIDCNDNDPDITNTNINDADCDGIPATADCDDNDATIGDDICSSCTIICPESIFFNK